jgi:hypothetical protein
MSAERLIAALENGEEICCAYFTESPAAVASADVGVPLPQRTEFGGATAAEIISLKRFRS